MSWAEMPIEKTTNNIKAEIKFLDIINICGYNYKSRLISVLLQQKMTKIKEIEKLNNKKEDFENRKDLE